MTIEIRDLYKSYHGTLVLTGINAVIGTGINALIAPSGSGKTTLLRILLGLESADSGHITGAENCRFAAVFQEDRLLPQRDAMGNLRFVLGEHYDPQRAEKLLEGLGLDPASPQPVREYSGGMCRRLALARALLAPSDMLVLDEPFAGLDAENRSRALAAIRRYGAEKPILLTTHHPEELAPEDRMITL